MSDVRLPSTFEELWALWEAMPQALVYAGGTDLLVKMRAGLEPPSPLICLERMEDLKGVSDHGESVRIGAGATHARLLANPLVRTHLPVLAQALETLGSPPIRHMGTIGGNICTASPAGDTLPPLYVLDAEVELRSREGVRRMPIRDFITGPGRTQLRDHEILSAVWVRKPAATALHHFEKVGLRNALACSVVSLAALMTTSCKGVVEQVALAWGSVGPTIVSIPEAEVMLRGNKLTMELLRKVARLVEKSVAPISDVRADADYRRAVAGNLLLRLAEVGGQYRLEYNFSTRKDDDYTKDHSTHRAGRAFPWNQ